MISHQTHDEEKGDWHLSGGLLYGGQTDLIVFAFHLPALMEPILIHVSHCHPCGKPSQVENTCISHSYFNKPRQPPYKDARRLYFLC